ncbi:MAG TPA: hypothetical protein VEZ51_10270 [Gemmatimonadaceae bacterium]|nr:hypothetical protein [Gemmatimonadaceae bacterium]
MPQTPAPQPVAPAVAPVGPFAARATPSASAIYQGFRAQRRELTNQLDELEGTRREITSQLEEVPAAAPERKPLEDRLNDVDSRIKAVDQMLAGNAAQIAQAAAIPGAVVETPPPVKQGPPEEAYVLGGFFMILVFFPLSIALARRIWRRSAAVVTSFPRELSDRLARLEQATEATSLEVERIGEGQRFLTRLFTEGEGARVIGAGAAQPIETKRP